MKNENGFNRITFHLKKYLNDIPLIQWTLHAHSYLFYCLA